MHYTELGKISKDFWTFNISHPCVRGAFCLRFNILISHLSFCRSWTMSYIPSDIFRSAPYKKNKKKKRGWKSRCSNGFNHQIRKANQLKSTGWALVPCLVIVLMSGKLFGSSEVHYVVLQGVFWEKIKGEGKKRVLHSAPSMLTSLFILLIS